MPTAPSDRNIRENIERERAITALAENMHCAAVSAVMREIRKINPVISSTLAMNNTNANENLFLEYRKIATTLIESI